MDRSLTALAFFIAVALTAALLWPVFTDWEEERANLEAGMAEILGGPVSLEGDVSVRILPTPRLTATQVSLSDTEGRLSVSGADLRVEVALWPLFLNKTVVNRFVLEGGTIQLNGNASSLRGLADEMASRMSLGEGRFRYVANPDTLVLGTDEDAITLQNPHLELWSDSDGTLIRFAMRALEEDALRADVTFRPQAEGPWRVDWRVSYLEDAAEFRGVAELDRFYNGASLVGEFSVNADDINRVLGWPGEGPAFNMRGPFRAAGPQWYMDPTQITLGTMQAVVELQARTENGLAINGQARSTLADLDALGLEISTMRDLVSGGALGGTNLPVPDWVSASFTVSADGLMLNSRVIRDLDTDFRLMGGQLHLNRFAARLPGGTEARFYPRRDRARGLTVNAASLRGLLDWLEFDVGNISAEYLQELVLEASISEGPGPLRVDISLLELDGGSATGTYALDENGALSLEGEFSNLDLDAYSPSAISGSFIDRVRALAELIGTGEGAGFNLRGENVTLAGADLARYHFAARSTNHVLEIEQAEMVFSNEGTLSAHGTWSGDGNAIALELEGTAVDPALFEGLPLAPTAPADLTLRLEDDGSGLRLQGTVRSAGLEIDLDGRSDPDAEDGAINGRLIARSMQPGALARAIGLDEFAGDRGPERLDVRWTGPLADGDVVATLDLAGLSASVEGRAADIFSNTPHVDMTMDVQIQSAATALVQLGGPLESDLAALDFATLGRLTGADGSWRFQSADGHLGDVPVAMDMTIDASSDATWAIAGSLRIARLAFGGDEAPRDTSANATSALAWSTEQFDLGWMDGVEANLTLAIDELELGNVSFSNVGMQVILGAGSVAIEQARGTMDAGILTGSGTITRDGRAIALSIDVAGEGLPAAPLLAPAGLPHMQGQLTLAAHLEGRGRSPFDLVASLGGRLDVDMGEGAFDTIDMGHLEEGVANVRTRIALREVANQAVHQGTTPIARLSGLVPVSRGVLNLDAMVGVAETGAFSLSGLIDLRSQIVDMETAFVIQDKDAGDLPVTVAFRGVNGELNTSIDITQLQAGIEDRLADAHLDLLSTDDLPEELQELLQAYEEAFPEEAASP